MAVFGTRRIVSVLLVLPPLVVACRQKPKVQAIPITPACVVAPTRIAAGSPASVTYTWTVGPGAPKLTRPYSAFVHFVDKDGVSLFTDDHVPTPPVTAWEPGGRYQYKRTMLVPALLFTGPLEIRLGLFDPAGQSARVPLAGTDRGLQEYAVGSIEVVPDSGRQRIVYKTGWYQVDAPPGDPFGQRRWTAREAWAAVRNRGKDVLVVLKAETNLQAFARPPRAELAIGGASATWTITEQMFLKKVRFPAAALGQGRWAELKLALDQSFVPKRQGINEDDRELGLWVHYLHVAPVDELPAAVVEDATTATHH
jgi:hypothetical protein